VIREMADEIRDERIPRAVMERLPRYLTCLTSLKHKGVRLVSSKELGLRMGLRSSQIRKDFAIFGEFGMRGIGYDIDVLISMLRRNLGLNTTWNMAFLGAGDLAIALSKHDGLKDYGFNVVAFFDDEPGKIGRRIGSVCVRGLQSLPDAARQLNVEIGVITLPVFKAQEGADLLVEAGVKGIWNLTPMKLELPPGIAVYDQDLIIAPLSLSYSLSERA
jgi:redox-sensing transcriptional repressor